VEASFLDNIGWWYKQYFTIFEASFSFISIGYGCCFVFFELRNFSNKNIHAPIIAISHSNDV
ncbi:MAG: hypothetical protein K9L22_10015, partial [Methylococcaceae bacterium]|nr:hypothetical protein [Methylococcaceae bacterium]